MKKNRKKGTRREKKSYKLIGNGFLLRLLIGKQDQKIHISWTSQIREKDKKGDNRQWARSFPCSRESENCPWNSTCDGNLARPVGRTFQHGRLSLFDRVYVRIRVHIKYYTSGLSEFHHAEVAFIDCHIPPESGSRRETREEPEDRRK